MHVDLLTLYLLGIGTLLASAGMTFWEQRTNPRRGKELRLLAMGFTTLALGCALVLVRHDLPGALGSALSHLVMLGGYLLVLRSIASFGSRGHGPFSIALLAIMAAIWAIWGTRHTAFVWSYVCGVPIALVSAMTAREMLRCEAMTSLHSRHIIVAVTSAHAVLYAARAFLLPWLVSEYGEAIQGVASKLTIYEGVLYSVLLPMAVLKLIREEDRHELLRESHTDYLTRLGNRRWFFEHGARVVRGKEDGQPACVLAFDLDRFKSINDRYGHHTGDKVLKVFAETALSVLGPDALLARLGGEEFAALLSGNDALRAKELGETIASRFAETIPGLIDGVEIPTTVSIGLAWFDDPALPLAEVLAAADQALYRAKSLGGNRLELALTDARPASAST